VNTGFDVIERYVSRDNYHRSEDDKGDANAQHNLSSRSHDRLLEAASNYTPFVNRRSRHP